MPEPAADPVATVKDGYAFAGAALDLGALVVDGQARADVPIRIPLAMLNRHGLVAGATGTGKTKTLQLIAEQLSAQGVPVFLADIKGDLSGMATPGVANERIEARAQEVGQHWAGTAFPCQFYALGGVGTGVPVRVTITSFGPLLLSRVLDLNDTQESSLQLVFHYADQEGLPLLDLKDLRSVIQFLVSDDGKPELQELGGLARSTAGVILRELLAFEAQGADRFFGEPEFATSELLQLATDGRGTVSVLELPMLQDRPALFSTFLMWLLADLFEELPEVGDIDRPKLVFFFDEAHLLFDGASKAFLAAITQTVRLIRSKGIGVFFVTQTPKDVPADVLAQLGNRFQHALRAFTPDDAKALKATVSTFPHSDYDLEELLTQLGIGEAVVTVLSERGAPTPVAWTRLRAPESLMAPSDPSLVAQLVAQSPLSAKYGTAVDRESAYEMLVRRIEGPAADGGAGTPEPPKGEPAARTGKADTPGPGTVEKVLGSSAARSLATSVGREVTRGLFDALRRRL
jgi:DNA helicase HerA-like ATPase